MDKPLQKGLPSLILVLAAAGGLSALAYDDYSVLSSTPTAEETIIETTQPVEQQTYSVSLEHLSSLFGEVIEEPAVIEQENLPETRLDLTLAGTFTHADSSYASALIAESGKSSDRYFVGSQVPGGAELIAVNTGSVVLRRNGQDELLRLPILKEADGQRTNTANTYARNNRPDQVAVVNNHTSQNQPVDRQQQLRDRLKQLRTRQEQNNQQ